MPNLEKCPRNELYQLVSGSGEQVMTKGCQSYGTHFEKTEQERHWDPKHPRKLYSATEMSVLSIQNMSLLF